MDCLKVRCGQKVTFAKMLVLDHVGPQHLAAAPQPVLKKGVLILNACEFQTRASHVKSSGWVYFSD